MHKSNLNVRSKTKLKSRSLFNFGNNQ